MQLPVAFILVMVCALVFLFLLLPFARGRSTVVGQACGSCSFRWCSFFDIATPHCLDGVWIATPHCLDSARDASL